MWCISYCKVSLKMNFWIGSSSHCHESRWLSGLACGLLWLALASSCTGQTTDGSLNQKPDKAIVAQLIRQLGADDFQTRQEASRQLLEFGASVVPELKEGLDTKDPEVRGRLQAILIAIGMQIPLDSAYTMSDILAQYEYLPEYGQYALLSELASICPLGFILDFLNDLPDQEVALERQTSAFSLPLAIATRSLNQDSTQVLEILRHPFVQRHYPDLSFGGLRLLGQADAEAERWLARSNNEERTDSELMTLIVALEAAGRMSEARSLIERIKDVALRKKRLDDWDMKHGRWDSIWAQLPELTWMNRGGLKLAEVDHSEAQELMKRLTIARLAGRDQDYPAARDLTVKLLESVDPNSKDEAMASVEVLLRGLLINGEVEVAMTAARRLSPYQALQIANNTNQFDVAREILELPAEVAERWKWITDKTTQLRTLSRKYSSSEDTSNIETEIMDLHSMLIAASEHLANVGLHTDATVLLENMLTKTTEDDYQSSQRRKNIVETLAGLQPEDFWKTVTENYSQNYYELWYLQNSLFSSQLELSRFWNYRVQESKVFQDQKLNAIAMLINDPLAEFTDVFDLEALLAEAHREAKGERPQQSSGEIYVQIGLTYLAHGRWQEYRTMLEKAANDFKNSRAAWFLGRDAYDEGRWLAAIEYLSHADKSQVVNSRVLCLLMLSRAYRETGDEQRADDTRLAAYCVSQMGLTPGAVLELITYGFAPELIAFDLGVFANTHALAGTDDLQSARWAEIQLVQLLQNPSFGQMNLIYLLANYRNTIVRRAAALSAQNLPEEAERLIQSQGVNMLSYGSLCEKLIPTMEQRGQTEVAERIFNRQADWFVEQLKQYPNSNTLLNSFAWTCVCANRRLVEATYCSERSLVLRPRLKHYLDTLAALYFRQGRHAEAIELTKECLMLDPEYAHYRRQLQKFLSESAKQTQPAVLK
jgi:tetratricopeptide (TPR) repeat protein